MAGSGLGGVALALLLSGCFSAPPQITSLEPNRGSTSVAADAPVRVVFDKPVVPASVDGHFSVDRGIDGCDLTAAFHASPTAPCWIHWLPQDSGFELLHAGAVFAPATRYLFTLSGGFADASGDVNGLDHHWDLTTAAAPRVAAFTPADGSAAVPVDSPLVVTFSGAMDGAASAAAITLEPPVAGTRVVRNLADRGRFVILPGQLLDPGITYTISVSTAARGEDHQGLVVPATARFVAGARLASAHAAVLAGRPGEGATEVLLPALAAASAGEPGADPVLLRSVRCAAVTCGGVAGQAPLETFSAVAVAADSAHVAVQVQPSGTPAPVARLEVIETASDRVLATIAGATRPSWSPGGTRVAYAVGKDVQVLDTVTGRTTNVATDTPLVSAPLWSGSSTLVLSVASAVPSATRIELVDLALGARYDLPGAPSGAAAVAVSPSGGQLAVATDAGLEVVPVAAAGGSAQRLAGRLDVIGFSGEATLLAVSHGSDTASLVRINIAGGDSTPVHLDVGLPDLGTARLAADGRRLAFLAVDPGGVSQAYVTNADGSGPLPVTRFLAGDVEAQAIDFAT